MVKKSLPSESAKKAKPAAKPAAKPTAKPAAKPAAKAPAKPAAKAPAQTRQRFAVPATKLKEMAKELAIKGAAKMEREVLIHAVQVAEGHAACYARIPDCGQMDCLFRPDCLPEEAS